MLLKDLVVQCIQLFNIWLCLTNAVTIFKYKVSDWRQCEDDEEGYLTFRNLSIQPCIFACRVRQRCVGLKFFAMRRECKLLETDVNKTTEFNSRPCIYIRMVNVVDILQIPDVCQSCSAEQICEILSERCSIEECGQLSLANAVVSGNVYSVGSKVTISPDLGYTLGNYPGQSTCQDNGQWDVIPTVKIVACSDPPTASHATVSNGDIVYQSVRTYTCDSGYDVTNPNADMTVTCLISSAWSTLAFQCTHGSSSSWWLGMTDMETEDVWRFTQTDKVTSFFHWGPDEPSNSGNNEHCAVIGYANKLWADVKCNTNRKVICEN